ncbi:MAG TPA: RagB/SusD family nutrient uptake outer membrane protein [Chitinophagaceae bacterium]|nr:RagB/SusD family nutrient uptake outer membrane protein [Chitinophagaceae bacterium]
MKKYVLIYILLGFCIISCKKMVEIGPPKTQLTPEKAFADDRAAVAVISNVYAQFNSIGGNLTPPISSYIDELATTSSNPIDLEYYNGWISVNNNNNLNSWRYFYSVIYQSNSIIDNIEEAANVTAAVKQQLKGEALFLRALSFFYLVNIYGDVPLLLTTDVRLTSLASRAALTDVYTQIIEDLSQARNYLVDQYPSAGKVRANKWAAAALLARIYLYQKNWAAAESEANAVISSGIYTPLDNLASVFKYNNKESILQFWMKDGYTTEGLLYIPVTGSTPTYTVAPILLNSFEPGDQRKQIWTDSIVQGPNVYYYPYKYKNRSVAASTAEYLVLLRLSEQYLIRAEARAQQDNVPGSKADLNTIRNRAGLSNTNANDKPTLLAAISQERRVELFCEWGHRFFDLKRNGQISQVMSPLKQAWHNASALLPIPQYERLNNPNLSQNLGY